jgi:hypothetical protein
LASLERFDPQNLRYFSDHLVDVYEEAATIARPPLQPHCRRPLSNKTGYIVCVYKVFEGDDGEKFERNWLYWTGTVKLTFFQLVASFIHLSNTAVVGHRLNKLFNLFLCVINQIQKEEKKRPLLRPSLYGGSLYNRDIYLYNNPHRPPIVTIIRTVRPPGSPSDC